MLNLRPGSFGWKPVWRLNAGPIARKAVLAACILLAAFWIWTTVRARLNAESYQHRVYKIGFSTNARPLHFADAAGRPDGLAVSMVQEAARRKGIRLSWVQSATPGIEAMQKGEADFWVLMTDLPERHNLVHFTEPFLVSEYCFLVLADSPFKTVADLSDARVKSNGFEIIRKRLTGLLPNARFSVESSPQAALDALAEGSSDAVFLEQYAAGDLLLTGRPARKLRMIAAPVPRGYMGMAANFDVGPVADAIRDEMRNMESDGSLARQFEAWSFFPGQNLDATDSLSKAQRRERFLSVGVVVLLCCVLTMVGLLTRLRKTEHVLSDRDRDQRALIELLPDTIYVIGRGGSGPGIPSYRLVQGDGPSLDWLVASESHQQKVRDVLATGGAAMAEVESPQGRCLEYRLVPWRGSSGAVDSVMGILRDRTEQRRMELERASLEDQLRQAQKMEVVGRLAGGVAHDLNNLLTVIMGYGKLLLARAPAASREHTQLSQIDKAARSAATLTHQLLAFSRKQVIQPRPGDLNRIVADSTGMLGRLLGDDILLETRLAPALPFVVVDRGHVEQVLMNLAANSRDAMPGGGRFSISTEKAQLTASELKAANEVRRNDAVNLRHAISGKWIVLSVADSGPGMDRATAARIFEPFFTTKPEGQGTGLGLSIVYGIVHQNGGWIQVDSRVGEGTGFRIFLPEAAAPEAVVSDPVNELPEFRTMEDEMKPPSLAPANKTILIVEDQEDILALENEVLSGLGYHVIGAADPADALRASEGFPGEIHLLLTDVVLTGMRGPELARLIANQRPEMKLLFVSGSAGELEPDRDSLILESGLLRKPFAAEVLVDAVRRCLQAG